MFPVKKRWILTAVVKDRGEQFVIVLIKAVKSRLQIIFRKAGAEAYLSAGIVGGAEVRRRDGKIIRLAVEVRRVVVEER